MGAPVPESVKEYPERVHGMKHWVEYTLDSIPSQYHAVWEYMNGVVPALACVSVTINPGYLSNLADNPARLTVLEEHPGYAGTPQEKFAQLVDKYEEGKTADELVVILANQGYTQMFLDGWGTR